MSDLKRFFVDITAKTNDIIKIAGDEYLHLTKVLRAKVNDEIIVCLNDGYDNFCVIETIDKSCVTAKISKTVFNNNEERAAHVTLCQAVLKGDKMDFAIQKAVELGASAIIPFESAFTVVKIDDDKIKRLNKIAIEACKQCRRAIAIEITKKYKFTDFLKALTNFKVVFFCNETDNHNDILTTLLNEIEFISPTEPISIAVVIGCEGGFKQDEINLITQNKNVFSISLGKRILRADTASVAVLSILNSVLTFKEKI